MFSNKEDFDNKFDMKIPGLDNELLMSFDENEFNLPNPFEISTEDNEKNEILKNKEKQIKNCAIQNKPFTSPEKDNNNNANLSIPKDEYFIYPEIDNNNNMSFTISNEQPIIPEIDNNNESLTIPNEVVKLREITNNNIKIDEESQFVQKKENIEIPQESQIVQNNENINDKNEEKAIESLLSKKTKNIDEKKYKNMFNPNNILRKCKHIVLDNIFNHLNNKIREFYKDDIGKGICKKQFLSLNSQHKSESNIKFNKELLNTPIKDIFSANISGRYTIYAQDYNKKIVDSLLIDKDPFIKDYFTNLFNLTFIQCLEHYAGKKTYNELIGMQLLKDESNSFMDDEYVKNIKIYLDNFENIINRKRSRKSHKRDNIKS